MGKANLVALFHALSGAAAMVASPMTETGSLASVNLVKPLGFAIFAGGMLMFAVVVAYLKKAYLGDIEPVTDTLITTGPYRRIRHPLYLGMFLATFGLAIAFRSLWALLITFAIFVPLGLYRARLEEQAMARMFGQEWDEYAGKTYFILPPLY